MTHELIVVVMVPFLTACATQLNPEYETALGYIPDGVHGQLGRVRELASEDIFELFSDKLLVIRHKEWSVLDRTG